MGLFDFFGKFQSASPVLHPHQIRSAIKSARYHKTDLLEVTSTLCCEECAKFTKRIFSISGFDRRFPKLPEELITGNNGHNYGCLSYYPFVYGVSEPSFKCKDLSKYSRRPFVDDRTPAEIKRYNNCHAELERMQKKEAHKGINRAEFQWLQSNLPDICPKSFSAYVRMKNANSKNYQKLVTEAEKLGKTLS